MASHCRAPVQLEDLLRDDDSASSSDADTYDEELDIASVAGTFFFADTDDEESDEDTSDAARPRSGDEEPAGRVATPPKYQGEKRDRAALEPASTQPRPIDVYTFPDENFQTPKRRNTPKSKESEAGVSASLKTPWLITETNITHSTPTDGHGVSMLPDLATRMTRVGAADTRMARDGVTARRRKRGGERATRIRTRGEAWRGREASSEQTRTTSGRTGAGRSTAATLRWNSYARTTSGDNPGPGGVLCGKGGGLE